MGSCEKGEEMSLFLIRAWGPLPDGHTSTGPLREAGAGEALNGTKMGQTTVGHSNFNTGEWYHPMLLT